MASIALKGIKVLDLSRILAAPLATQMLGDLGAEVIKVERPLAGDDSRDYGPPFLKDKDGKPTRDSAFYLSCNRNKRSVAVDLASPEGQEIVRALARKADVVIENFKTGTLKKYGLDYESLKAINPRVVYASVTGFGQSGPLSHKPGYDGVFQAMSGFSSVSGHPDHLPGGEPMKHGASMVDILTSLYTTVAILGALYHRDLHDGPGQYIDMALLDCGFASLSHVAMNFLVSGEIPPRRGNGGFGGIPSQTFKTKDGRVYLTVGNDTQFARFCQAIEHPELVNDPRFAKGPSRIANRETLVPMMEKIFLERTTADWLDALDRYDIPSSPVNNLAQAVANPQLQHRKMIEEITHPAAGTLKILRNPIRLSETPVEGYTPPPSVGQHTEEVLTSLGYDRAKIEGLRARKVI